MNRMEKEYGDDGMDGLVPPSKSSSSLEIHDDSSFEPSSYGPSKQQKSLLWYIATVQAFVIIYRTEVLLGTTLAICIGIAFAQSYHGKHKTISPFQRAQIGHDYTAVTSKYDLTLGSIDHWCVRGDDNSCRCEDPLEPMSKRSSKKW